MTLDEAALLAGLPKAPQYYSPVLHPDRALKRRNLVINAMLEDGKITAQQATEAKAEAPATERAARSQFAGAVLLSRKSAAILKISSEATRCTKAACASTHRSTWICRRPRTRPC